MSRFDPAACKADRGKSSANPGKDTPTHMRYCIFNNTPKRIIPKHHDMLRRRWSVTNIFSRPKKSKLGTDAFISHDWGSHKKAKRLNTLLRLAQVDTWFDEDDLQGDIVHSMTSGIDNSSVVVACVTRKYIEKCAKEGNDNCKLELDYAYHRKGGQRLIAVVIDKDCLDTSQWTGKVGAYLAAGLYFDCTTDRKMIDSSSKLVSTIRKAASLPTRKPPLVPGCAHVVPLSGS